jgi:hypothetical protein
MGRETEGSNVMSRAARAVDLREGAEGVAAMLRAVHLGCTTIKALSRRLGLPIPILSALRRELERAGVLERNGGVRLTERGRRIVEVELGAPVEIDPTCAHCDATTVVVDPALEPVTRALEAAIAARPTANVKLDQAFCTATTSVRRALLMLRAGALEGKSAICVGDDDLVSLAIVHLGKHLGRPSLCRRLTVIDTDPGILAVIRDEAARIGASIECVAHDLREPLPAMLRGAFDTFETDPPYTVPGVELFVSRAIECLKPGVGRHGFLSIGSRFPSDAREIQASLATMGLYIEGAYPRFNTYEGNAMLGSASQMLHVRTTAAVTGLVPDRIFVNPIYTGEMRPTVRLYACTACGVSLRVGSGETHETIEQLKQARCPTCRNEKFRRVRRIEPTASAASHEPSSENDVVVREARREDLVAAARFEIEIRRISFPEDAEVSLSVHLRTLEKAFGQPNEHMVVLDRDGSVAGWAWLTMNRNFVTQAMFAKLRTLAVSPDVRGSDAPMRLLDYMTEAAWKRDAGWIVAHVSVANLPMRTLYKSRGFSPRHLTMELRAPVERRGR